MLYLIQITRKERAERPSEKQIFTDSKNAAEGKFSDVVQVSTTDNFFVFTASPATVSLELMRILATMPFSPFALKAGDGFRVIPYQHEFSLGQTPRQDCQFQVQTQTENGGQAEIFSSAPEALFFIDSLKPSDGYVLVDELDTSKVLSCRPSLWLNEEQSHIIRNPNLHGRTEKDR